MGISDHTPTKSSRTTQEEVSKLQELMKSGANDAATYLESLKNKFADYDKSHNSPKDSATSYFQAAMDRAHASVEMLKNAGENVRADGNSVSDSVVDSAKRAMDQTGSALDDLGKSAQSYDQRMRDSINSNVANAKESGSSTMESWKDSIASLVTSTRESTFQGFEALQTHLAAMQTSVAEYASAAADSISNTASDASEKLKPADANPSLMERASGAVSSSVDYVTSTLQGSK
ncbi:unnamed protein product [Peronospora belbahrii]|uniref:Uncharacterized protein n=1 Tax=Peronospora belbahrii TaxID=622444 RepID=A0AAU9LAB2_9STRA|nr:unnamed protein product [Peronospora belbahrii]CAH0522601.1 unnamed protein product [Peronospora belbahrii]